MGIRYLHTMVRVLDLERSIAFYKLLGLEETRRYDNEGGVSRLSSWRRPASRNARSS